MVTKKHSKKGKDFENQDRNDHKKMFGVDLKTIGGAIATAVVTEIAQTALNKATHIDQNDHYQNHRDGDQDGSVHRRVESMTASMGESLEGVASTTGDRLKDTLSNTGEKLENWHPNLGEGFAAKIAQEILDEVKPAIVRLIEAVIESAEMAYRSAAGTLDSGKNAAGDVLTTTEQMGLSSDGFQSASQEILRSVQNGVADATKTAKTAFEGMKPSGKSKKKKKNKKAKK